MTITTGSPDTDRDTAATIDRLTACVADLEQQLAASESENERLTLELDVARQVRGARQDNALRRNLAGRRTDPLDESLDAACHRLATGRRVPREEVRHG